MKFGWKKSYHQVFSFSSSLKEWIIGLVLLNHHPYFRSSMFTRYISNHWLHPAALSGRWIRFLCLLLASFFSKFLPAWRTLQAYSLVIFCHVISLTMLHVLPQSRRNTFWIFFIFGIIKNNFLQSVGLLAGVFFARAKMRERSQIWTSTESDVSFHDNLILHSE